MDKKWAIALLGLAALLVIQAAQRVECQEDEDFDYDDSDAREYDDYEEEAAPLAAPPAAPPTATGDDDAKTEETGDDDADSPSTAELIGAELGGMALGLAAGAMGGSGELAEQYGAQPANYEQPAAAYPAPPPPRPSFGGLDLSAGLENKWTPTRLLAGLYYGRQYASLNEHLVRVEPSRDYATNMRELNRLLDAEIAKGVGLANRARVEALEQLVALDTLGRRCDLLGYVVLWRNNRATRGEAHRRPSELRAAPSRVELLVHKAMLAHAIECLPRYPAQLERLRAALEPRLAERVERFTGVLVAHHKLANKRLNELEQLQLAKIPFDAVRSVYGLRTLLDTQQVARLVYLALRELAANDPEARYLRVHVDEAKRKLTVNAAGVRALLERHLVAPCRAYVDALGPDVFIPTKFDSRMLEREDLFSWRTDEFSAQLRFMRTWINYRFCHLLVFKESGELVKRVTNYIKSNNIRT